MTDTKTFQPLPSVLTYEDVRAVSPALEQYTKGPLLDGLWKRPELSPRDRSIVTVSALIARIQTIEMPFHFALALDNAVKPGELSEKHHTPCFLLGLGERYVSGRSGEGYLSPAWNRDRSASTSEGQTVAGE